MVNDALRFPQKCNSPAVCISERSRARNHELRSKKVNHGLSSRSLLYGNHVVTYYSKPASALDQTSSTPIGNDMDGGREDISRLPHCLFPRFHLTSSKVKCDMPISPEIYFSGGRQPCNPKQRAGDIRVRGNNAR